MIDYTVVRRLFEQYIATNFTEVPVQYENTRLHTESEFIAVFDQEADAEQMGMNETSFLIRGLIIIQIFTALGSGTQRSREIATKLSSLLNNASIGALSFEVSSLTSVGQVDDADYYQQNLTVPYSFFYNAIEDNCNQ